MKIGLGYNKKENFQFLENTNTATLLVKSFSESDTYYTPRDYKSSDYPGCKIQKPKVRNGENTNESLRSKSISVTTDKSKLQVTEEIRKTENLLKADSSSILGFKEKEMNTKTMIPPIFDTEKRQHVMDLIRTDAIFHEINPAFKVHIGTHSGTFHCDEILAIAMLRVLPEYKDAAVVRTRDKEILAKCDIVVDVGAEYNPEEHRYDHHQRGFEETMDDHKTKLSSSGLIYKHFGKRVMTTIFNQRKLQENKINSSTTEIVPTFDEAVIEKLHKKVYEDFMEHIDGIDNGIPVADGACNYKIESHMSSRIGRLNPSWNMESNNEDMERRFSLALQLASTEFFDYLISLAESWWPGRLIVEAAFEERLQHHSSGEIIVLEKYCPWIAHLEDIETERNLKGIVKYVLYMDSHGSWRIHAAPVAVGSFASRLPLPEAWRGTRDEELSKISGLNDCTFVHANGFIGGNKTLEGTLAMGIKSIEMQSV